jgi:hypothetical protein
VSEKDYVFVGVLLFLICILLGAYDTISGNLSVQGQSLQELRDTTVLMQQQNLLLEERLLHAQALSTIETEARKEGFVDATYILLGTHDGRLSH